MTATMTEYVVRPDEFGRWRLWRKHGSRTSVGEWSAREVTVHIEPHRVRRSWPLRGQLRRVRVTFVFEDVEPR